MAARKSCTHMTWAEAKAKSGVSTSKSGKVKQPPARQDHGKLLAAKIVAKNDGRNEEDKIKDRQAARRARKDMARQEQLDQQREEEKEKQRLVDVVKTHQLALERLRELSKEYRNKKPSLPQSSIKKEEWKTICESKQLQMDEMVALEAIYADTDVISVSIFSHLEELQQKLESWQSDPDVEEKQKAVVDHPPLMFTLQRSLDDPCNVDVVAHVLLLVSFPPEYPLITVPPAIDIVWFFLTQKLMEVSSNKPLDGTNLGSLKEEALQQALQEQAEELLGMPNVFELLDTYLSEHLFEYIERSVAAKNKESRSHICRPSRLVYTLDVLTDGSEYTGHGTLFLSAWKTSPYIAVTPQIDSSRFQSSLKEERHDDSEENVEATMIKDATLLGRYAISGLGDSLSRLCADQRFKLAPTRALFVPSRHGCLDGLSALLLALHGAGSPSLHVVLPPDGPFQRDDTSDTLEELANICLGNHKHLNIVTCQIREPENVNDSTEVMSYPWWKVYDDDFLEVHASCCMETLKDFRPLIFLYSFLTNDNGQCFTNMAVLPPNCTNIVKVYEQQLANNSTLPLLRGTTPIGKVEYVVMPNICSSEVVTQLAQMHTAITFLECVPNDDQLDKGLLIRSQQLAKYFHSSLPLAFVVPRETKIDTPTPLSRNVVILHSNTSLVLTTNMPYVVDRGKETWKSEIKEEWSSTVTSLQPFCELDQTSKSVDENEIHLDDEEDEVDVQDKNTDSSIAIHASGASNPRLLVVGTGCATPSAYRGASGYALVLPGYLKGLEQDVVYVLDCGEGYTTMLSRNWGGNGDWKSRIKGIWISHAHLDHYGGLPSLLRVLYDARFKKRVENDNTKTADEPQLKRPRNHVSDPVDSIPWVMGPPKVLRYLDIVLNCREGRRLTVNANRHDLSISEIIFQPLVHNDPAIRTYPSLGPFSVFESIPVQHNCCPSYGLLVGWKHVQRNQHQFLCYSGDTRPCLGIVHACRRALWPYNAPGPNQAVLTLIHEATFDDHDVSNAKRKMHTTGAEAIQVAKDIPASKLLLSHFSQRYVSLQIQNKLPQGVEIPVGLAADGLWMRVG